MTDVLLETSVQKQAAMQGFNQRLDALVFPRKFNPGINTKREFEFRGHVYKALAVPVMDRKPFFEMSDAKGIQDYYIMDIVNLRQADLAVNPNGNSSADLLLNHLSQIVINHVKHFNGINEGKEVLFCRYGGDEFGFSYSGMSPLEINAFNSQMKEVLGKMYGFYRPSLDYDGLVKGKIGVEFKDHSRPTDDLGKAIFDHFKGKKVLLNAEEISKMKNKFGNDYMQFRLWRVLEEQRDFYPDGVISTDDKLDYLSKANPLLTDRIKELKDLADNSGPAREAARYKLTRELEKLFEDPLLKRPVITGTEMLANIKAGNISHVWTKDLKFMKELNSISYADGDSAIETLWSKINECIDPADSDKLVVARNGGTILLGLTEGKELLYSTKIKLAALDSLTYKGIASNDKVKLPIGSFDHEVSQELRKQKYGLRKNLPPDIEHRVFRLMVEESKNLYRESDRKFYSYLAYRLMLPDGMTDGLVTRTYWDNVFKKKPEAADGLFTAKIIRDYFISKRASQRLTQLELAIDKLDITQLLEPYMSMSGKEREALEAMGERQRLMLRKLREAMNYAYTHTMTHNTHLEALRDILCS